MCWISADAHLPRRRARRRRLQSHLPESDRSGSDGHASINRLFMYRTTDSSSYAITIARPPSTYAGRTTTGIQRRLAPSIASSIDVRHHPRRLEAFSTLSNSCEMLRSSPDPIDSGEVPIIFRPAAFKGTPGSAESVHRIAHPPTGAPLSFVLINCPYIFNVSARIEPVLVS